MCYITVGDNMEPIVDQILNEVKTELESAQKQHGAYPTYHHGYAVILEELNELWDEIKLKNPDKAKLKKESLQVATTAVRFIHDLLTPYYFHDDI
jgi:hypothetical protein